MMEESTQDDATAILASLTQTSQSWSTFDLTSRRPRLDQFANHIQENRESSQSSRKILVSSLKSFKKSCQTVESSPAYNPDIETLIKQGRGIVKSFQDEVDSLTRRCKSSDNAYMTVYKAMYELPDPAAVLQQALRALEEKNEEVGNWKINFDDLLAKMEKLENSKTLPQVGGCSLSSEERQELEQLRKDTMSTEQKEEILQLRKEVEEYEAEFQNLTNQDITIRKLEGKILDYNRALEAKNQEVQDLETSFDPLRQTLEDMGKENEALRSELSVTKSQASLSSEEKQELEKLRKERLSLEEREELLQLRREVSEYETEFKSLKNQDITIRKLESKIVELQRANEEEVQTLVKKAQEELAETEGRRASEALEREAALERRLQSLELELRAERAGREATNAHMLKADEGAGEREAAWEAQKQIMIDDSERLREALHHATRERDDLRLKIGVLSRTSPSAGVGGVASPPMSGGISTADVLAERRAYEAEVNELTLTISTLRDQLRAKDETTADQRRALQSSVDSLERENQSLSSTVNQLRDQIASAPSQATVEAMKRELRILKRLEFNAHDVDDNAKDPEITEANEDDLETVLVSRLRKSEAELLKERREKEEAVQKCDDLEKELSVAQKKNEDSEQLISRLETDLHKAISAPSPLLSSNSNKQLTAATQSSDPNTLQRILNPDETSSSPPSAASLPTEPDKPASQLSTAASDKASDDHSVATIVMAQRDRLRARCDALEAERDSFKRELQMQVTLSESLKSDNTKLYEKVRYLQNFANKNGGGRPLTDRDIDLEALEERYEASVDPFRQFSQAERRRKLKEMSTMERMVFYSAKTVLANKKMRTALFLYVCTMHFLVFVTTYHWAHEAHCDLTEHAGLEHMHGGIPLDETGGLKHGT